MLLKIRIKCFQKISEASFGNVVLDCLGHGFLYYTRTDFMPLADSQNKAKINSVFLYPVYSSLSSIHLQLFCIRYL